MTVDFSPWIGSNWTTDQVHDLAEEYGLWEHENPTATAEQRTDAVAAIAQRIGAGLPADV